MTTPPPAKPRELWIFDGRIYSSSEAAQLRKESHLNSAMVGKNKPSYDFYIKVPIYHVIEKSYADRLEQELAFVKTQWKQTSDLLEQERNRLTAELADVQAERRHWYEQYRKQPDPDLFEKLTKELADVHKARDELLTAMAVVKQKFKADCELNEDTANLWLKVLNENTFLHQELDQALSQAAALAGALEKIIRTNAKYQSGGEALKVFTEYRAWRKGRE